jgi:signal transduction histidine kinase
MAAELAITIRVTGVPEELIVAADHQRLKQVLLNFVSNAIKYNRHGGWVEITAATRGGSCRIAVQDSGPGIRREEMERLFAPFERLSAATSGVEGTGLGLALSKSLTEAMGGRIGVTSRVGKGSTFWVELPLRSGGGGLPSADAPEPADATGVELVKDAPENLVGHRAGEVAVEPEEVPGAGAGTEDGGR